MLVESSITSISWIPSEAVKGAFKVPFSVGMAHYDDPPPEQIDDLTALRDADRFRFANELRAWIEVEDRTESWGGRALPARGGGNKIVRYGFSGEPMIGATTIKLGSKEMVFQAVPFHTLRTTEVGADFVKFVQTAGGRTGAPSPRPVPHPPFFQIAAPTAWTTLSLTLFTDGRAERSVDGASPFPRHWVYDGDRKLFAKSGLIDFKEWFKHAFGQRTPWGDEDSPALVTEVETAMERELSTQIMRGGRKPSKRKVKKGGALVEQGDEGAELFLLLDGVLSVEVDGEPIAEVGPGAILGERALLESGKRTSTLRALTAVTVVAAGADDIDRDKLEQVAATHRREEQPRPA